MIIKPIYILLILFVLLYSCGEQPEQIKIEKKNIENEIIRNFLINKNAFEKLNTYFKLNHIKVIEFPKNNLVCIQYIASNESNRSEWIKLENKEIPNQDVNSVLRLDSLSLENLLQLKTNLEKINTSVFWLIDIYDISKRKYIKAIDLKYITKMNGLTFYYRIYQDPINSIEENFYSTLIRDDSTGGIINNHLIWYYK